MTAALLLTLDATPVEIGGRGAAVTAAGCERLLGLLDAHAMAATWLVGENVEAALTSAIGSMRAPQDIVRRPRGAAGAHRGPALAACVLDPREAEARLDAIFAGEAGRGRVVREWVPGPLRRAGFRSALHRAIRDGSICHVFCGLAELSRCGRSMRLLEDLLFRVAEERRLRRVRVVTLGEVRNRAAAARLVDAA